MHEENHLSCSALITDVVIGVSDGLTVPFALTAGLSAALSSNTIILTVGLAEIAVGSIAMGVGGYLAGRAEADHYNAELRRRQPVVVEKPEAEKQEVRDVFTTIGLSPETQHLIVDEMAKDKEAWIDFTMKYKLGPDKPYPRRARNSAFNIGLSYIAGGLVPLSPYFFTHHPKDGLLYSCVLTIACLAVFGFLKAKATGQKPFEGATRVTLIGSAAAAAAFGIVHFFS